MERRPLAPQSVSPPLVIGLQVVMFPLPAADASDLAPQKRRMPLLPQYNVAEGAKIQKFDPCAANAAQGRRNQQALCA